MYISDLHIHSKYSRATSRDCDTKNLDMWARRKGISLIGTGDFTHPSWREELKSTLEPAEDGFYSLKKACRIDDSLSAAQASVRFVLSGEISTIYKKNGKTRKVHSVILLPDFDSAEALALKLEAIGNIRSDGRPILGLDCHDLLEITLDTCPDAMFIPAHIWTPHFSLFGAFSGFDTIEECFEDLTGEIHALETGLSSDPPMNWRVSALDRFTLVSNSDAHSPSKLGREANILDTDMSYNALRNAIFTGKGFNGTIEFFPEEGKYHLDGHRSCGFRTEPEETVKLNGKCPVCGKKITIGVQHRTLELADRPFGYTPEHSRPFYSLIPLPELIGAAIGSSASSKSVWTLYSRMLMDLGSEFRILRETSLGDIEASAGACVAEGVKRLRNGSVHLNPGYDGEYGEIILFENGEREALMGQPSLFDMRSSCSSKKHSQSILTKKSPDAETTDSNSSVQLNDEQLCAVTSDSNTISVIAGPGTGKTNTLVSRIEHLIEDCRVKPSQITAVTFTNKAAEEMKERLAARFGGKSAIRSMNIGTFHSICIKLLSSKAVIGEKESMGILKEVLQKIGSSAPARDVLMQISRIKNEGLPIPDALKDAYQGYSSKCRELNVRDLDDLLLDALSQPVSSTHQFDYLFVDEFQDINPLQRKLINHWSKCGKNLFVIGDPDQSIYGFRGSDAACFVKLKNTFPCMNTIILKKNYRSSPEIISAAMAVINKNGGCERNLVASKTGAFPKICCAEAVSDFSEAVWISKKISAMSGGIDMLDAQGLRMDQAETRSFSDIAVLCRTRRQLEIIEKCLLHDNIPCTVYGRESYLDSSDVQGIISFFRLLDNPKDILSWKTYLENTCKCANNELSYLLSLLNDTIKNNGINGFFDILQSDSVFRTYAADFIKYSGKALKEKPVRIVESWIDTHGSSSSLEQFKCCAIFYGSMKEFINTLVHGEEYDVMRASGKKYFSGAVSLMTLHSSKGLEFPVVFIAGAKNGMLPLERKDQTVDIEEERRLLFVGMTRAKEQLLITWSENASPFISELPSEVEKINIQPITKISTAQQPTLF